MLLVELVGLAHETIDGRHDEGFGDSIAMPPEYDSGNKAENSQNESDSMNSTDSLRYEPDHEDDLDGASEELGDAGFRMRNKKHGFHDCIPVNRPIRSACALMLTL